MLFSTKPLLNYQQRLHRLRMVAMLGLLALLIPVGILLALAYQQLDRQHLADYQRDATELMQSINRKLFKKLTLTNTLDKGAFDYYQQVYNPLTNSPQQLLSPLAQLQSLQDSPGLVGYFQLDQQGRFNSPIWPYRLPQAPEPSDNTQLSAELITRKNIASHIFDILSASDSFSTLERAHQNNESGLFTLSLHSPDYFIFSRRVDIAGQKRIQGYLVKRQAYLQQAFSDILELKSFRSSVLIEITDTQQPDNALHLLYEKLANGQSQVSYPGAANPRFIQQPILTSRLHYPYQDYSVSLSTANLPLTTNMLYSGILMLGLVAAIFMACYGFYRLGIKQLALAGQQLNFVSSVSHELKTPLTSIRMYSEMLKDGMITEKAHRQDYYGFIFAESERLTRLINNILQLSQISHQQQFVRPAYTKLARLEEMIDNKVAAMLEKSQFRLNSKIELADSAGTCVFIDPDAFVQILFNLTDNAIKFFDKACIANPQRQQLDFIFKPHAKHSQMIELEIRDYGQGISNEQQKHIFELFYRGGDELTRTTNGTGIGLALVKELVLAQGGDIRVVRKDPGLAVLIGFQARFS
ncbi:sensor histidine kinase [Bowmanella denitrificans]|uniref:sensor histidine kinase n=1 Tax=Bowmanella denitrificans TaxID=366582 RepID=UPI000C9B8AEA|nr:histidine kinase dimerization/phospho-acceptor domain-containing protein [Bowmanella denitrificans]